MHVTIVVGQTSPQFLVLFSLFFKVVFPLSHACCLISVIKKILDIYQGMGSR
jgi:hypothetical protein